MASTKQMQERAKAARLAANIKAVPSTSRNKFRVVLAADINSQERRAAVTSNEMPILDMGAAFRISAPTMVRNYIAKDDDLTPSELMHFTNWCYGITQTFKHKGKDTSKTEGIWADIVEVETLEQAQFIVSRFQNLGK